MERDWGAMQCCTYAGELGPWVGGGGGGGGGGGIER